MIKCGFHYNPADVLPHREPLLLLDSIQGYGEDWLQAEVQIRPDSFFADAHGVPSWVGIEYMAQAVCAWSGIEQVQRGEPPGVGLLLGSRRYEASCPVFITGSRLQVRIQMIWRDSNDLGAFDCTIHESGKVLATAQLKVYRPPDARAFLERGTS